jgi:hypothetical protein
MTHDTDTIHPAARPTDRTRALAIATLALGSALGVLAPSAGAQDEDVFAQPTTTEQDPQTAQQPAQLPAEQPAGEQQVTIGQLLAQADAYQAPVRLGARAHVMREAQQVYDTVIVVSNANDAARVISSWGGLTRFPVLIDDGSVLAAENIARFNRAFKPGSVLRWTPDDSEPWPDSPTESARRIIAALGLTFDRTAESPNMAQVLEKMRAAGMGPNGAVVIDPSDESWIAGLALAAGRSQIIVFAQPEGNVNGQMSGNGMRALAGTIQQQLERVGVSWENLGDEIDSVTLVGNGALRVGLGTDGTDEKALTDLIGRHRSGIGNRWAWTGAMFGDAPSSLYRAMCGLFLPADSAWLFDGYGRGDPWDLYDATSAGRILERGDFDVEVHDLPSNRVRDWRKAVRGGIDADLVLINSKGGVAYFALGDGNAYPGDIPLLDSPTAVHIVHSWSSRIPGSVRSVAGRWFEHGAYLFYGSVDEPYLNAFVQTPQIAGRLLGGLSWGVAVRQPSGPAWKLNVLGDPLVTFRPDSKCGTRLKGNLAFKDAKPLKDVVAEMLKAERYDKAIRFLVMAGRDDDAARLSAALLSDKPEAVGNAVALQMIMPLARAERYNALADAYNRVDPRYQSTTILQDALWHAGRTVLEAGPNTQYEGLLRRNLRRYQEERDAVELSGHILSRGGRTEALAFLNGVAPTIDNANRRKPIEEQIRKLGG